MFRNGIVCISFHKETIPLNFFGVGDEPLFVDSATKLAFWTFLLLLQFFLFSPNIFNVVLRIKENEV